MGVIHFGKRFPMHCICWPSSLLVALVVSACSSDSTSSSVPGSSAGMSSTVAANQPGAAGTNAAAASAGGSNGGVAEGVNGDIGLNQGGPARGGTPGSAPAGGGGAAALAPGVPDAGSNAVPVDAGSAEARMSFFVTSRGGGNGGNFGGLAGADQLCTTLAAAVSPALGAKTWRAYLSTSTVNARDRIGSGPWTNAAGVVIGTSVAQLHDQAAGGASEQTWPLNNPNIALDERGNQIPAQPLAHDILTGSTADGRISPLGTCEDWTQATGTTSNGHSNRAGQATDGGVASSWNFSHITGCAEPTRNFEEGSVSQGGGRGSIYCFAAD
jgi:hypothetical protein